MIGRRTRLRSAAALAAAAVAGLSALGAAPMATASRAGSAVGPDAAHSSATPSTGPSVAERAVVGEGALSVRISQVSPDIPSSGDTLTLSGSVTNVSADPVGDVSALLRVSPTALPSRGEITEVLDGTGLRLGEVVAGTQTTLATELAPGQEVTFRLEVAVDDLALTTAGVYVTGVEALGDTGAGPTRQDLDRTFLPWWPPDTSAQPALLTTLWPISTTPVRDASGVLLNDTPAAQLDPGGRLDVLLDAAATDPGAISLVIDPNTVDLAGDLADGYNVTTGDDTDEYPADPAAADWLARLSAAVTRSPATSAGMLNGAPDLVAARRGGILSALLAQRGAVDAQTEQVLGTALPSEVALLPGGAADERTLSRLARADVPITVLSDEGVVLASPTFFTPSGAADLTTDGGQLHALITDSRLNAALAMPTDDPAGLTAMRQTLLAETLVTVLELAQTQRLLVMAPDVTWNPSATAASMIVNLVGSTPWLVPTSIQAATEREPSSLARALTPYDDAAQAQELTARHVGMVAEQYANVGQYASVLADPEALPESTRTAPNRAMSSWFRTARAAGQRLVNTVSRQLDEAVASVQVVSSGSVTVAGASGTIPVTVENNGPLPVIVGVTMTSTPPQLFTADPVEPFLIEPGRRTSVDVTAQVAAAGPIPVRIQLTTSDGADFGVPGAITVQSSAYANAAGLLVRIALAALAVAVIVHGIRRARRMRDARARARNKETNRA